ncbi:TPA: phosphomethylpyrimidine synthase ThiC [bacterium]|nr:phosphomethylpyrimidine synthase ThiC [bacterium]
MTQIESAKLGKITSEMEAVANQEGLSPEYIRSGIEQGTVVIPHNIRRNGVKLCGIGAGLKTKINANLGTSSDEPNLENELQKLIIAVRYGADTVMDLSTGGDLDAIRRCLIDESPITIGSVPIYNAAVEAVRNEKSIVEMTPDDMFHAIEKHVSDGIDFITVHCGTNLEVLDRLREQGRVADVVSRGGAFLIEWMIYNEQENPLYSQFDRLLEIAKEYDVTLSLGDGLRPGCLADATDRPQIQELIILGELASRSRKAGVQAMIEGPGHVPINEIEANILLEKKLCNGAPFYVLGPLVTDVAPGYDHITSAIGGAIAGKAGADFLCYVTPAEHLCLPTLDDVREGVIASKIAAHVADLAKGIKSAHEWDAKMGKARKELNWTAQSELSIDPELVTEVRGKHPSSDDEVCTMCGKYCAMKGVREYLANSRK